MAVFRVKKNKGYTVMSNHHLRNNGGGRARKGGHIVVDGRIPEGARKGG